MFFKNKLRQFALEFKTIMMINFVSLVQIGIRDNSLKLCEKEILSLIRPHREKKIFFFFLSFSHNLNELSLIPI